MVTFLTTIKNFVFQEPQNKNESPKAVVVLRIACMLFMFYLFCAGIGLLLARYTYMATLSIVFFILYANILYCSYQDKLALAYFMLNINTVCWIVLFYLVFGDGIGVQHFMIALTLVDLMLDRKHPVLVLSLLYIIRLALFFGGMRSAAANETEIFLYFETYMYVLSIILEWVIVLFTGIYFTKDAFQMESRLREYNKELHHAASTDPLTKVWNRFRMLEHVELCLKKYRKGEMAFLSIAIGDIDFFKRVNDTYGHECGDAVLKALANLFDGETKPIGAVARWGGEEFLFLFENMNGDEACAVLTNIQAKINRLDIPYEGENHRVTMTFGLTEYDFQLSLDDNIKQADDKLYSGKNSGRNRIVY